MNTEPNLRETLISAGIALLSESAAALTLRKCAAHAGVSHAAPAHHFKDMRGLLTAIAAKGFENFTKVMLTHRDQAPDQPRKKLYAICQGYLEFAQNNPALYGQMFASHQVNFNDPELAATSSQSFQVLHECCAPLKDTDDLAMEIAIWSALHGYAGLTGKPSFDDPANPASHVDFSQIFDRLVPAT